MRYKVIAGLPALLALLFGCVQPQPESPPSGAQQGADSAQATDKGSPGSPEPHPAQPQVPAAAQSSPAATQGSAQGASKPPPARSTSAPPQSATAGASNGTSSKPAAPRNSNAAPAGGAGKTNNATTAAQPPVKTPVTTPASTPPVAPTAPSLDLPSLEARLKQTRAIGVFTKLSLKNQVDDLLSQFRAFHGRKVATPLSALRDKYDLLLLKVLSLLQDGDPDLAAAISSSRETIWGVLADPQKFAKL